MIEYGLKIATEGIPQEDISCPECGNKYGHRRTKVCTNCEECSACCRCKRPKMIPSAEAIQNILNLGRL
jgi:hypothetical protein